MANTFKVGDIIEPTWKKGELWEVVFVDAANNWVEAKEYLLSNPLIRFFSMNDIVFVGKQLDPDTLGIALTDNTNEYNPGISTFHTCTHKWVDYVGLVEQYKFCSECDEKDFKA